MLWSSLELSGKLVGAEIDPFALTAWRFMIGGWALLPLAFRKSGSVKKNLGISSILHIGSLGILNVCVSMLLLQLAIYFGKASLSAVIVGMNPLFVSVFAMLLLKEKLTLPQIFSLVCGLLGLGLIIAAEKELGSSQYRNLNAGIILSILAAITFGFYTVLNKTAVSKYGNILTNSLSFIIGGTVLTVINLVLGKPMGFRLSASNILLLAHLGLIVTGLSYMLYFEGMKKIGAARASVYFFLKPALATLLAYFILHERLGMWQLVGIAFVMIGLGRDLIFQLFRYRSSPTL